MSTHIRRLCDSLELPRADAWAAHVTVERWLRAESEPDSDTSLERLAVGSRLLERLETGDRMTREQLSLLVECCGCRLNDEAVPERDRESLTAVIKQAEHALELCSTDA